MSIEPIAADADLRFAFRHLESICQADEGTPQADETDVLVTLIEAYESEHCTFGPADPVGGHQVQDGAAGPDSA